LLAIVGLALARPQPQDPEIEVVRDERENAGDGTFRWAYELSDGTLVEQNGYTKESGDPENPIIQVIEGSFAYTAEDGTPIKLQYIADENGFQPTGDHLPTPPPQIEGY